MRTPSPFDAFAEAEDRVVSDFRADDGSAVELTGEDLEAFRQTWHRECASLLLDVETG